MATQEIRELKRALRKEFKSRRERLDKSVKAALDEKIRSRILNSQSFKYADTVLMFCPTESEVDILPIFEKALSLGKRVAFPRCKKRPDMDFFYVTSLDGLTANSYGIKEPDLSCEKFEGSLHPFCIVPCLSSSKNGYRLGYGGGFYDKFLSKFEGISASVVYEDFLSEKIPTEKRYDKKTDLIITEKGVFIVG